MNYEVRIERLVIDGPSFDIGRIDAFRTAIEEAVSLGLESERVPDNSERVDRSHNSSMDRYGAQAANAMLREVAKWK